MRHSRKANDTPQDKSAGDFRLNYPLNILNREKTPLKLITASSYFLLLLIIWFLDRCTGPAMGFSIFYAIPIALISWNLGLFWGCALSLIGCLAWAQASPGGPFIVWNAFMRLCYFLIVVLLLRQIKISVKQTAARNEARGMSRFKSNFIEMTNLQVGRALKCIVDATRALDELELSQDQGSLRRQCQSQLSAASGFIQGLLATTSSLYNIDSNDFSLELRRGWPDELVRDTLLLLEPLIAGNDVEITTKNTKTNIQLKGDQETLAIVMKDSLLSAIKLSEEGKTINIRLNMGAGNPSHLLISTGANHPGAAFRNSFGVRIEIIRKVFAAGNSSARETLFPLRLDSWSDFK